MTKNVFKKILKNGLTVLARPLRNIPKVSVQLWYNVGSKDEASNEKGIAHLIEHMIFKGTEKLSESDINLITSKLSGYCNAFTSYDYTGYLFDFPSQNWKEALPIMADCMTNCTFKEELLNSELKAVIQELKMYKDDYNSVLIESMLNSMFPGHPYQHPIIGYKQDLWNLTRENLVKFYKKHYVPNNATLVIVGDVSPDEVFELAEKNFGHIEPNWNYKKEEFYLNKDISRTETVIYRDVQVPTISLGFIIPGAKDKIDYIADVLGLILAEGRDSRLHKKLVNTELVTEVSAYSYDLFDNEVFFIQFDPTDENLIPKIVDIILKEIENIKQDGLTDEELNRSIKKVEMGFFSLLENNQKQAYALGKFYLATQDEDFIFNYIEKDKTILRASINDLLKNYLNSAIMHTGKILPINKDDVELWHQLQLESDAMDQKILSKKSRTDGVEPGAEVNNIKINNYPDFKFPKYNSYILKNGLEILYYENPNLPKIDIVLELKAKYYYDDKSLQGIGSFVSEMLLEGTKKYNCEELAEKVESLGMTIKTSPGFVFISMLSEDLKEGLEIAEDILINSVFDKKNIEKIRNAIITDIKNYWDSPSDFASQLIKNEIYKDHPFSINDMGTIESISKITQEDLINYYKKYISPRDAKISIVGDFKEQDLKKILSDTLEKWNGPEINSIEYPELSSKLNDIKYKINRDQVVLVFAGRSISRLHQDFDKLLLFDQIFGGGVLGSMSSRLFQIREQSGLFYTISGSLLSNTGEQPGMFVVKTIVSLDRLQEAENLIIKEIHRSFKNISDEELEQAKNALINSRIDSFSSNKQIASSFLFLRRYNLPEDFFDKRADQLLKITKEDVQEAAEKILTGQMMKLEIGRV